MSLATLANDEILRTNRQTLDLARIYEPHLAPLMNNLARIFSGGFACSGEARGCSGTTRKNACVERA